MINNILINSVQIYTSKSEKKISISIFNIAFDYNGYKSIVIEYEN